MKKTITVLSLVLAFIMSFGVVTASAKGIVLSNDKFYVEIPDGFEICTDYGDDHYYFENSENVYEELNIYVEANFNFPDGIKKANEDIIENRFERFISDKEISEIDVEKIEKGNINGINACYVFGTYDGSVDGEQFLHAYILTTKENIYIVSAVIYAIDKPNFEKEPDYLKETISSFLVNGTYYDGEKLAKPHDFSKVEHYIDALERDMLTDAYYEHNYNVDAFATVIIFLGLAFPIVFIVLIVLYVKTRKKLKEYKEFFGSIEQAKVAMYQQQMQRNYQPYSNAQQYGYAPNVPPSNMQTYNSGVRPTEQPQYMPPAQPMQTTQPAQMAQPTQPTQSTQLTLSPEMQEFKNNDVNN